VKIALVNYSGNVGKSTLAQQLLAPRMGGASIIPVETINEEFTGNDPVTGKQYKSVVDMLQILDDVIIDVGSSNVEEFLARMKKYRDSHKFLDYIVIPTTPDRKQQHDTISTIEALAGIGIVPSKIRMIFNRVDPDIDFNTAFDSIRRYFDDHRKFTMSPECVITDSELYELLMNGKKTVSSILADKTDYGAKITKAKTMPEKLKYAHMVTTQLLARGVEEELDRAFSALFPDVAAPVAT